MLYLTLEKRYKFSLDELDVVANGCKHFRSFFTVQDGKCFAEHSARLTKKIAVRLSQSSPFNPLSAECGDQDDTVKPGFVGEQIDLAEVPQYQRI